MSPVVKERNHCSSPITNCPQANIYIKDVRTKGSNFTDTGWQDLEAIT